MVLEMGGVKWIPVGLQVNTNLEHGYPYVVVLYQRAGSSEIKRGEALYVSGCSDAKNSIPLSVLGGAEFSALATLQNDVIRKAIEIEQGMHKKHKKKRGA